MVNASIYHSDVVKARNGSVDKHFLDFYRLTMVNLSVKPRIYQFSGFYGDTCKEDACEMGIWKYEIARN
jgi:hypothetical protein